MAIPSAGDVGIRSEALGDSIASRNGQFSYGSGAGGIVGLPLGASQESRMTMTGSTPGLAPGESVELLVGPGDTFSFEDDRSYIVIVSAIARSSPFLLSQSFRQSFVTTRAAGASSIVASGVLEQLGNVGGADWTLVASIGAGPDRFVLTFSTGPLASAAVRITARVEFVEIAS